MASAEPSAVSTGSPETAKTEATAQYSSALPVSPENGTRVYATANQPTVELAKTSRLPVPVLAAAEIVPVQTLAMASPTMPPVVPFKPQPITAAVQPPAPSVAQSLAQTSPAIQPASQPKTQQMASLQPAAVAPSTVFPPVPATPAAVPATGSASTKTGRIVSPLVAPAVASGQISPAAAEAIALDEKQLTPDMVALQSVVPIPRPDTSTLAYASAPRAVAAVSAIDRSMEFPPAPGEPNPATASEASPELLKLIKRYAGLYGVPESLVHRVVHRESKYDPKAYHKNGYWGLMQIKYATAKSMGYQGKPEGLLDAETNLKYAIKYLRGAWLVADNQNDNAIKLYARGYYNDAKRKDMLQVLEK